MRNTHTTWTDRDMAQQRRVLRKRYRNIVATGILVLVLIGAGLVAVHASTSVTEVDAESETTASSQISSKYQAQLAILNDDVDTSNLNATQETIYALAKSQFATHATSYDSTVLKYTQGYEESWCADFISWIRNQAGVAFINPNSGSWRIPGVSTLQEYFQTYDAYHEVGEYTPKLGDVAFYNGTTLSGDNSQHVALVLGVKDGNLITIGGNETDEGTIQVRADKLESGVKGLSGFGESNLD